ncbi:MAG: pyridoxamine 5'-phosphate oxidase family protein [Sulfuricella sp.]
MSGSEDILAARRLLRSQHSAALATLSLKQAGHPFASGVDYFTDYAGRPVFLISSLAEHSKNITADPRISLLVQGASNDVQASPRLTVVGKASGVSAAEAAGLKARYLRYFPDAEQYFALDFFFCRLEPEQLRYVGGFGVARWIASGDFLAAESGWEAAESAATARFPTLVGLDCDGFDLRSGKLPERRDFAAPLTPDQAANALAALTESPSA